MIPLREFAKRAGDLHVSEDHVRRDYVLNHVLASISDIFTELIFRGGTALARIYWPDFRLSEDLDFIVAVMPSDIEQRLGDCIAEASRRTTWKLELKKGKPVHGRHRFFVASDAGELLVDILSGERPSLPNDPQKLILPYSDLADEERSIPTTALAEILGDKWYMLDDTDRKEPRDLYDLWAGLSLFKVPFDQVAEGHRAKYRYLPHESNLRRARELKTSWKERLSHQLSDLPEFDLALEEVSKSFEEWKRRVP